MTSFLLHPAFILSLLPMIFSSVESHGECMQDSIPQVSLCAEDQKPRQTYVLTIAKTKVPHGKLQLIALGTSTSTLDDLVTLQGALLPCRFGLVKTATTMKAATNKMSKRMSSILIALEPVPRMMNWRSIAMRV